MNTTVNIILARRLLLRASFGLVALIIPFLGSVGAVFFMLLLSFIIILVNPKMHIFMLFATVTDKKSEVLVKPLALTLSLTALCIFSVVSSLPLYIISDVVIIVTLAEVLSLLFRSFGSLTSSLVYVLSGGFFGFLVGSAAAIITSSGTSPDFLLFVAMIGALVGALLRNISHRVEENVIVPLGIGFAMWLFDSFNYSVPVVRLLLTLLFMILLGYVLGRAKLADLSGILSGILMGFLIVSFTDFRWFVIILAFFVIGGAFTKYKYDYKRAIGIAQEGGGARGYRNVFGNGLTALVCAIAYGVSGNVLLSIAYVGAVATATGDTLASEIGQTHRKLPRLITDLRYVPHGTDGGITTLGEYSALVGAAAIALIGVLLGVVALNTIVPIILGGFFGANFDSVLGAVLERRHYLTNSSVNLLATISGAIASIVIYLLLL
ncbi:MAG: TIGR00297 family protein [Halobacteriota archaeon]